MNKKMKGVVQVEKKFIMVVKNKHSQWEERITSILVDQSSSLKDSHEMGWHGIDHLNENNLQEHAEIIVKFFNSTLRPHEEPRTLVCCRVEESTETKKDHKTTIKHDWKKMNLITIMKGGNSYDIMECSKCGITGKRFGLGFNGVLHDSKYKAKKYNNCIIK